MIPLDKNHDMELIKKAKKVCDSCVTSIQVQVAKKYMDLLAIILIKKNSKYFNNFVNLEAKFHKINGITGAMEIARHYQIMHYHIRDHAI